MQRYMRNGDKQKQLQIHPSYRQRPLQAMSWVDSTRSLLPPHSPFGTRPLQQVDPAAAVQEAELAAPLQASDSDVRRLGWGQRGSGPGRDLDPGLDVGWLCGTRKAPHSTSFLIGAWSWGPGFTAAPLLLTMIALNHSSAHTSHVKTVDSSWVSVQYPVRCPVYARPFCSQSFAEPLQRVLAAQSVERFNKASG